MILREELIEIGYFTKPHGVKGEISMTTTVELPAKGDQGYLIAEVDGIFVPFFIESVRSKGAKGKLVKLEGVDDEQTVRQFSHRAAYLPNAFVNEQASLEGGWRRLIGYLLIDEREGEIGTITGVDESTINVLLEVDYQGEELLVSIHESMISAEDQRARTLVVTLPEGLLFL